MKKFYAFAIMFLALFSCVFLSACGDKYKNLTMSFVNLDGDALTEVHLWIDDSLEEPKNQMRLGVKFSGIDSDKIGTISVASNPRELVVVSDESFTNDTYFFTITASNSGSGQLEIIHNSSNKKSSIKLIIDKKSSGLSYNHNLTSSNYHDGKPQYIVAIPPQQTAINLNPAKIFSLYPVDSTDIIKFGFVDKGGMTFNVAEPFDIKDLLINPSIADGSSITVYPITTMDGYELTESDYHRDYPIEILFKTPLTDDNVVVSTSEVKQPYVDSNSINNPFYLIAKDNDRIYRTLSLSFNFKGEQENVRLDDLGYLQFYGFDFEKESLPSNAADEEKINVMPDAISNFDVSISAAGLTKNVVAVRVKLVPINSLGELTTIVKTIYVKGENAPTKILATMQGEEISGPTLLYDYYTNGYGALFKFTPLETFAFDDLRLMRMYVDENVLNFALNGGVVYTSDYFTEKDNSFANRKPTNKFVLDIFKGFSPLKFYYDDINQRFVSEVFKDSDNIYIRYEQNQEGTPSKDLSIEITADYLGNTPNANYGKLNHGALNYLQGFKSCDNVVITFENRFGVKDMTVYGGYLTNDGVNCFASGEFINAENVYLNRLEGLDNSNVVLGGTSIGAYVLYVPSSAVIGDDDKILDNALFDLSVRGGDGNPLKLLQYEDGFGNGRNEGLLNREPSVAYRYENYNDNAQILKRNAIIFVFDGNVDVGSYQIVFSQNNGFEKIINCSVYQQMTTSDFSVNVNDLDAEGKLSFKNTVDGEAAYLFKDYAVDYIVASGQSLNFSIEIENRSIFENIFADDVFDCVFGFESGTANFEEFVETHGFVNNNVDILFKKGTYLEDKEFLTIDFVVRINNFENILTPNGTTDLKIRKTFYVFDLIKDSGEDKNISLKINEQNASSVRLYPNGLVGIYYQKDTKADFKLEIDNENLLNYALSLDGGFATTYNNKISWQTDETSSALIRVQNNSTSLTISLLGNSVPQNNRIEIVATIKQFNITHSYNFVISIGTPVLSDYVNIVSGVDYKEASQDRYINVKQGEERTINAVTYTNLEDGKEQTDNVVMLVIDNSSRVLLKTNGNTILIDQRSSSEANLRLVVFAKDCISLELPNVGYVLGEPSNYLLANHTRAYIMIELILSTGEKSNPFLIRKAADFWDIEKDNPNVYYKLMANVYLNTNGKQPIDNFAGTILTDSYVEGNKTIPYEYSFYGIELNNQFNNLFTNFKGNVENVNFEVVFNYNLLVADTAYLGVFDKLLSTATLTNVSLTMSNTANFNNAANASPTVLFGGLVGANYGTIQYTSNSIVGVSGSINLNGNAQTYFGGLVGVNHGSIVGYDALNATAINANYAYGTIDLPSAIASEILFNNSGAVSSINIYSQLSNENSAVGGVVGLNSDEDLFDSHATFTPKITNTFASGNITATNNVGGIVGINKTASKNITITRQTTSGQTDQIQNVAINSAFNFINLKSSVVISGENNVGGLVGQDNGGGYYNCHYQILQTSQANGITGKEAVGGLVGYSKFGVFSFCSVMSYRWDYGALQTTFSSTSAPDIVGENYVGGLVGKAHSELDSVTDGTFANSVAITYSSVNALIALKQRTNVGGILSAETSGVAIVFNASFIGKLAVVDADGLADYIIPDNEGLVISNGNTFYNYVFEVVANSSEVQTKTYAKLTAGQSFAPNSTNLRNWAVNSQINGGYIYISLDGENPIFEVSPSQISVTLSSELTDEHGAKVEKLLNLNYYEFSSSISDSVKKSLNEKYNKIKISDKMSFNISPSTFNANNVRVIVESTESSVVEISNNYLIIKGVGQCEIIFYSALNRAIKDSINVIVTAPIGNDVYIINGGDNVSTSIDGTSQQIAVGFSNNYSVLINETVNFNGYEYEIINVKDQQIYLDITISAEGSSVNIADYLSIPNENNDVISALGKITILSNPFSVQVKKYFEGTFNFEIHLYSVIDYNTQRIKMPIGNQINFSLKTFRGPEGISASCSDVYLYPNAETNIFAFVKTDLQISNQDVVAKLWLDEQPFEDANKILLEFINSTYNAETQTQTFSYRLTILGEFLDTEEIKNLLVAFELKNGAGSASVEFEIYPQLIDNIEVKNYIYERQDDGTLFLEESNTLRPISEMGGLIVINMVPDNGYFDYLEIKDITGNEEIVFVQLTASRVDGGKRLDVFDTPTQDGRGIRLKKLSARAPIYVETRTSADYASKLHTVLVSAFDKDGNILKQVEIQIDVIMLPSISIEYVDPNGVAYNTSRPMSGNEIYLASGVEANFNVNVRNSNGDPEFEYSLSSVGRSLNFSDYFENLLPREQGYVLIPKLSSFEADDLVNATLTITAKTTSSLNNGKLEEATDEISLVITPYVIHNFSLLNSRVNYITNSRVLYGNFGVETPIEIYLASTDISYLDGGSYWANSYMANTSTSGANRNLLSIINILKEINGTNYANYISLGRVVNGEFVECAEQLKADDIATISYKSKIILQVNSNENHDLALKFNLSLLYRNSAWEIDISHSASAINYFNIYMLDFVDVSSILHPSVITTTQEFLDMQNRDANNFYILGNDLVLQNYVPFDLNVGLLDGNGRKIIIQSFAPFTDEDIYMGLFTRISVDSVVSNLDVIYDTSSGNFGSFDKSRMQVSRYLDLCSQNTNYSSVRFGGLAVQNDGVVTNCKVYGAVALTASAIENQTMATEVIDFNIGGMVCHNSATGYITNSDSYLAIYSYANIGGFVYSNKGKIASSSYDASKQFAFDTPINYYCDGASSISSVSVNPTGSIYANNPNIKKAIKIEVAGFVVYNGASAADIFAVNGSGNGTQISMCYSLIGSTNFNNNEVGNINAKNDAAGFVYSNSAPIFDCYVQLSALGVTGGNFAGFVLSNTVGASEYSISKCYTYINKGISDNRFYSMFAPKETQGIQNSIEILSLNSTSADYKVNGVRQVSVLYRELRSSYTELLFGNNSNGVWQISNGELPKLTSTLNKVSYQVNEITTKDNFFGLRRIKREIIKGEDGALDVEEDTLLDNGYGTENNPAIVYNIELWNAYFSDNSSRYVRIVKDIDFSNEYENPKTSAYTFGGYIQGNNMTILNYRVSSEESLEAVGLFKMLSQPTTAIVESSVSNLVLSPTSIRASRTQAVGALAGIMEGFTVYNIRVDNPTLMIIGGNAVGGLVGVARGAFDIEGIETNVGVDSETMANSTYNVYQSVNNGVSKSDNIAQVYYAGAVVGILDGYYNSSFNINMQRDYAYGNYQEVRNVNVSSRASVLGYIVGSVFGFVGERVKISNINVNLASGHLHGTQYTGGLVGENRGVIMDCSFTATSNIFTPSASSNEESFVSSGLVGLNLGGIVVNCSANANIVKSTRQSSRTVVGGIVGRNVNGYVVDSKFSGELLGYFTGGIIGTNYDENVFTNSSDKGALAANSRKNTVVPNSNLKYSKNGVLVKNFIQNSSIDETTLNYWFNNLTNFYSYVARRNNFFASFNYSAVLGLGIGGLQARGVEDNDVRHIVNFGFDETNKLLVFNGEFNIDTVGMVANANLGNAVSYSTPYLNIINKLNVDRTIVMFVTGVKISSFDNWERNGYSNEIVAFTNEQVTELKLQTYILHKVGEENGEEGVYEQDTFELQQENIPFYIIVNDEYNYNITCKRLTSDNYYALNIDFSLWADEETEIEATTLNATNNFAVYEYDKENKIQYFAGHTIPTEEEPDVEEEGPDAEIAWQQLNGIKFELKKDGELVRTITFNLKYLDN